MKAASDKTDLLGLAERLVHFGKSCGADEVEVGLGEGTEFSVDVRLGEVENLVEAGSRALGVRVIKDRKTAVASSSDLDDATLERLIRGAVRRAELANRDECAGLPELAGRGLDPASLDLYDPAVAALEPKRKIGLAMETERIGLADRRITNSQGATFSSHEGRSVLANSNGFLGEYRKTYCGLSLGLQAGATDDLVEDFWFSSQVHLADLESPESVARAAVSRTVRQLHPRKIKTQRLPVVFEPLLTASLMGFLFSCVSGTAVYQKASFLAGKLGEKIGNDKMNVFDDGLLPRRLGTSPFDGEGVPAQRTVVIEKGILRNFLCNVYAARKLGLRPTGNGDGGGVGPNNFFLAPGPSSAQDIVRSCERGLLLIRTLGHGLNPVSGEISQGAFGLFIENGEMAYPVSEITISGNLGQILNNIELVGNDLEFRGAVCGPTIKVAEMQISGL